MPAELHFQGFVNSDVQHINTVRYLYSFCEGVTKHPLDIIYDWNPHQAMINDTMSHLSWSTTQNLAVQLQFEQMCMFFMVFSDMSLTEQFHLQSMAKDVSLNHPFSGFCEFNLMHLIEVHSVLHSYQHNWWVFQTGGALEVIVAL